METAINKFIAWWYRNIIGLDYYYLKNLNNEYCWWKLTSYGTLIRIKLNEDENSNNTLF